MHLKASTHRVAQRVSAGTVRARYINRIVFEYQLILLAFMLSSFHAEAQDNQVANRLVSPYGTLSQTAQPDNSIFDMVAGNDRLHDNVMTLENDSVGQKGECGNAAFRFRDSVHHHERGALGYSAVGTGCIHGAPNTLYAEIGNIGPAGDPDDTSFAVISTHPERAARFPGTSYKAFEVRGDTGDVIFRSGGPTVFGTERLRILNAGVAVFSSVGLSLSKRTILNGASDIAGITDTVIYWNSATNVGKTQNLPECSQNIDGQMYVIKDEKGDADKNHISIVPSAGSIEGATQFVINTAHGHVRAQCDSSAHNWNLI